MCRARVRVQINACAVVLMMLDLNALVVSWGELVLVGLFCPFFVAFIWVVLASMPHQAKCWGWYLLSPFAGLRAPPLPPSHILV